MPDELHVRDAQTVRRVKELAQRTGMSMTSVVRAAVKNYEPKVKPKLADAELIEKLDQLLKQDHARLNSTEVRLEDMYDENGLPI